MGVTAFIPAKMMSQRLPGKNMRHLGGKPLLYYSIRLAQLAGVVDTVVVSSEDEGVLEYAASVGASVHKRKEELSAPAITNLELLRAWHLEQNCSHALLVLLQPTHPLRHPKDLVAAVNQMKQGDMDSLFTVVPDDKLLGTLDDGLFVSEFTLPRQKKNEPKRYRNTGSFYIFRPELTYLHDGEVTFGNKIAAHVLENPEFEIDIDTFSDFRMAQCMYEINKEFFNYFHR